MPCSTSREVVGVSHSRGNVAACHIRALPKLEGTVDVNIALILKFMANSFFVPHEYPEVPVRQDAVNDDYLFHQAPTGGLGKIRFHDWAVTFDRFDSPNVNVFRGQVDTFRSMLEAAAPEGSQATDVDFLLALGELFSLVVYGQLILENVELHGIGEAITEQIFDVFVRDFSAGATRLHGGMRHRVSWIPTNSRRNVSCDEATRRSAALRADSDVHAE